MLQIFNIVYFLVLSHYTLVRYLFKCLSDFFFWISHCKLPLMSINITEISVEEASDAENNILKLVAKYYILLF